jgi:hypothetical protein
MLTTVVGWADPFHNATEFDSKPVPFIVTVAGTPSGRIAGTIEVMIATGLSTLKGEAVEGPPPGVGFCTTI